MLCGRDWIRRFRTGIVQHKRRSESCLPIIYAIQIGTEFDPYCWAVCILSMAFCMTHKVGNRAREETVVSNCQRKSGPAALRIPIIHSCFPLPVFRDADADQLRIGQKDVGRQTGTVAVQEIAGNRRDVEDVLVVEHHLPAVLVGEDQRPITLVYSRRR